VDIRCASDRSLLVSFGQGISSETQRCVARLTRALAGAPCILNLHPAYVTVLVDFDPRRKSHAEIEALIRACWQQSEQSRASEPVAEPQPRTVEIPVLYGGEFGPDLDYVARHTQLAPERVIELHSSAEYLVHFLGFSPGFPYLGGLPAELATPRLEAPRTRVPAGSVAIGGSQTGIYPAASPGGWRIIGRTPVRLFDPDASPPALLAMGDRVRFVPVAEARF
jgi:KipI family sensor histidine kinase inhibitor